MPTFRTSQPVTRGAGVIGRALSAALFLTTVLAGLPQMTGAAAPLPEPPPAPQFAAPPTVSLNVPAEVFIGQDVSFTVTFDNNDPALAPGYGPIIDVILPATGADGDGDGLGNVTINADYLGIPFVLNDTMYVIDFDASCQAVHPFFRDSSGAYITVSCPPGVNPGDKLVALRLPFGSFTEDQPPAVVNMTVDMSNYANLGAPLAILARGGYEFGYTPLDDWCCGDAAWPNAVNPSFVSDSVTPTLFTLSKSYSGPEDEAASGPNFRTYYPMQYTVTVEIAPGQSITGLTLNDLLPDNLQYYDLISSSPGGASCTEPADPPPPPEAPGGSLVCTWAGAVSGTVSLTFDFYIPLDDASSTRVIPDTTGDDVTSCNNASIAAGTWTPLDGDDAGVDLSTTPYSPPGCEHTLTDKSIALQKGLSTVNDAAPAGNSPGDTLEYTLTFQISDYFAFNNLIVTDVISDGQRVDATFPFTIEILGNPYSVSPAQAMVGPASPLANWTYDVACDYSGGLGPECTTDLSGGANTGETTLTFRVSQEVINRALESGGRLLGGCVNPLPGGGRVTPCDPATPGDGPSWATITYRTVIQDQFTDSYLPPNSNDPSVDQGDVLTNDATVIGDVLDVTDLTTTVDTEDDGSDAGLEIGTGTLAKELYAINAAAPGSPAEVKPGDEVTYRITYTLQTGDEENLRFYDFLPLPVFDVGDPDQDGLPNPPPWTFDTTLSTGVADVPPAGEVKLGPNDTFYAYTCLPGGTPPGCLVPVVTYDTGNNSLLITYDDFDGPTEAAYVIDLLFTVTVSDDPFADRLYLTNQAHAHEGSTNAGEVEASDIIQIVLTEPVLISNKGVVATSNTNPPPAVNFIPSPPGPVTFNAPGTAGARWAGVIDSAGLAANPINSDLSGVDAGDLVTFAIVIENQGSSPKGAFDITINDDLPPQYQIPGSGLNLRIANGDNSTSYAYTKPDNSPAVDTDLFSVDGIRIVDPLAPTYGACQTELLGPGRNILVITFDLQLRDDVTPGDIINTSSLTHYAGAEGGPNHLPEDQTDTATVTVLGTMTKDLVGTEIDQTYSTANTNTQAVIGEIATYSVEIAVPEGEVQNAQLVDTLDGGLAFVDCISVTRSSTDLVTDYGVGDFSDVCSPGTSAPANPIISSSGLVATWSLGNITNNNRDNSTAETLTFVYRVVFLNVVGNQNNGQRNNAAVFSYTGGSISASAPNVQIIESALDVTKSINPPSTDAGNLVTFTVSLQHAIGSAADAFDVTLSDPLPTCPGGESLLQGATISSVTDTASVVDNTYFQLVGSDLTGWTLQSVPGTSFDMPFSASRQIDIDIQGTICYSAAPNQQFTNTATVFWTSLEDSSVANPATVTDRSAFNTDSDERTGADGVGGALNDYADNGQTIFTLSNVTPDKIVESTSENHAATALVAIGEVVRYRITVRVPEGTSPAFQVRDLLPAGMQFLDDGTATLALVSNDSLLCITPTLSSSTLGTAPWVCGDETNVDSITPTYDMGLVPGTITNGPFGDGTDPYFNLGTLSNTDNDADLEFAVIEFNALVLNVNGNQDGTDLDNEYEVWVNSILINTSAIARVTVVESAFTLDKTHSAMAVTVDAGDVVTYTVTFVNDSAAPTSSTADAFDVRFLDVLPTPYLSNLSGITVTLDSVNITGSVINNSSGSTIDITIPTIPLDSVAVITYNATVDISVTPGQIIDNTGDLTWTSLPGDQGTTGNGTGSDTPGAPGSGTGERNGSDGAGGLNDYALSDVAPLQVHDPFFSKSLDSSSATHTTDPSLAIGEVATFGLYVTLPEGTTPTLSIVDDLPVGLEFVTGTEQVVTQTSPPASCGTLVQDFAGSLPVPVTTSAGGSGGDITFDFGPPDLVVTADNNPDNNTFLICFEAVVLDEIGNQQSPPPLTNSATMTVDVNGVPTDFTDTADVDIVESELAISKTVDDTTPGPGQVVTFTLTVDHAVASAADAFDVLIWDDLPADLALDVGSVQIVSAGVIGVADNSAGNRVEVFVSSFPLGGSITITYEATVTAPLGATINNVGNTTWTSLSGDRTVHSQERNGDDGVGGALDDYAAESPVTLAADRNLTKALIADNHAVTVSPDVTIGELLTYQVTLRIPGGSTDLAKITDTLSDGLAFVTCSQITAGPDITSTTIDFTNPNNCDHGTAAPSNPIISNSGHVVALDLGNISNTAATPQDIVFTYQVVVLDTVTNRRNVLLDNDVVWTWATGRLATQATPSLRIIESDMGLEKTVDPNVAIPGSNITYTLHIFHNIGITQTIAYDLVITDVIPTNLSYVLGSFVNVSGVPGVVDETGIDPVTGQGTLLVRWPALDPGQESVIQFQATVPSQNYRRIVNTAQLEWTSLPGVPLEWPGQPVGVQSQYNLASTERRYDPVNPADFYGVTATAVLYTPNLPGTGFAPGRTTALPEQPAEQAYQDLGDLWLEIPRLGVQVAIIGIPSVDGDWDLTWLEDQAGYLEGTAFPTHAGNSAITAHVYTPEGLPGPFVDLGKLRFGDQVIIHAYGLRYIYEVRSNDQVSPQTRAFRHEEFPWVTLITCQGYNQASDSYRYRILVRAVQVRVEPE